jgi:hypothetical protein
MNLGGNTPSRKAFDSFDDGMKQTVKPNPAIVFICYTVLLYTAFKGFVDGLLVLRQSTLAL